MSGNQSLTAQQFIRHSRSIMHWGEANQQRLAGKQVLILGLGGLGSHVALALSAAGVGALVLIDDDKVELSNLPRQTLYQTRDIGSSKVAACQHALRARNPQTRLTGYPCRPDAAQLYQWAAPCDLLIDCSDNLPTRQLANLTSRQLKKPLFSAAISGAQAQIYLLAQTGTPLPACYHCVSGALSHSGQNCSALGVHPLLAALTAQQLAFYSLQYLLDAPLPLNQFALWQQHHFQFYRLDRDPHCPVCSAGDSPAAVSEHPSCKA